MAKEYSSQTGTKPPGSPPVSVGRESVFSLDSGRHATIGLCPGLCGKLIREFLAES